MSAISSAGQKLPKEGAKAIAWLVPSRYLDLGGPQAGSSLASVRYRVLLPMWELASRGHDVTLIPLDGPSSVERLRGLGKLDVVLLWKYAGTLGLHERIVKAAHSHGAALAYDVCDDYSEHSMFGAEFLSTIHDADIVIAASQALAQVIAEKTTRVATIISEPFEGPKGEARFSPRAERLKLLWFGHWSNFESLDATIPDLLEFGARWPLALTVVTLAEKQLLARFKQFNQRHRHLLSLRYEEWSPKATWGALAGADIVVIPQQLNNRLRMAKSPNRLVESMWAGRFVVASPIPAYLEFGEWAALHERIADGLEWTVANRQALAGRIARAQEYIEKHYSPGAIADRWERALRLLP